MLRIYTLAEAIAELSKRTGSEWSSSRIFDAALRMDLQLRAAPPRTTKVAIWRFRIGEGMVKKTGNLPWALAILYPQSIAEIWQTGETEVVHAVQRMQEENEYHWFEDPVVVQTEDVRIPADALNAMASEGAKNEVRESEKPLSTKERNTLLCIIAALCKEAKLPYDKPSKAAGMIVSTAAQMGLSLGETTVEGHLKKIPDALASRMK